MLELQQFLIRFHPFNINLNYHLFYLSAWVVLQLEIFQIETIRISVWKGLPHDLRVVVDFLGSSCASVAADHLVFGYILLL